MIVTSQYIKKLEFYYRMYFSEELKNTLLEKLGEEPYQIVIYSKTYGNNQGRLSLNINRI